MSNPRTHNRNSKVPERGALLPSRNDSTLTHHKNKKKTDEPTMTSRRINFQR